MQISKKGCRSSATIRLNDDPLDTTTPENLKLIGGCFGRPLSICRLVVPAFAATTLLPTIPDEFAGWPQMARRGAHARRPELCRGRKCRAARHVLYGLGGRRSVEDGERGPHLDSHCRRSFNRHSDRFHRRHRRSAVGSEHRVRGNGRTGYSQPALVWNRPLQIE